jgi:hypothetical protein
MELGCWELSCARKMMRCEKQSVACSQQKETVRTAGGWQQCERYPKHLDCNIPTVGIEAFTYETGFKFRTHFYTLREGLYVYFM